MTKEIKTAKRFQMKSEDLLRKADNVIERRKSNELSREESESQMNEIYSISQKLWNEAHSLKMQLPWNKQKRLHEILSDSMRNTSIISDYQKSLWYYNAQCIVDEVINKYGSIEEAVNQGYIFNEHNRNN